MAEKLALFDFDGTLIRGDSIARFSRFLFLRGFTGWGSMLRLLWQTLLWRLGKVKVEDVKSLALAPLKRLEAGRAEALCREFVQTFLVPRLYRDGVARLRAHAGQGDLVLLVSASPEVYLQHIREHLPVQAVIATGSNQDYQVTTNVVREEKITQIRRWLAEQGLEVDWEASSAYGDSTNDLPMLSLVGKPHLVNPHQKAKKRAPGIPVLRWK